MNSTETISEIAMSRTHAVITGLLERVPAPRSSGGWGKSGEAAVPVAVSSITYMLDAAEGLALIEREKTTAGFRQDESALIRELIPFALE